MYILLDKKGGLQGVVLWGIFCYRFRQIIQEDYGQLFRLLHHHDQQPPMLVRGKVGGSSDTSHDASGLTRTEWLMDSFAESVLYGLQEIHGVLPRPNNSWIAISL